jgi:hypothetical protein
MSNALAEEYGRLVREQGELSASTRKAGRLSDSAAQRMHDLNRRLREIIATPPVGYSLPAAADGLLAHAKANGWLTLVQWSPAPGEDGQQFVTIQVGRKADDPDSRGPVWHYTLTWHSRDCAPGRLRRFGRALAQTPGVPQPHDAPSLKAIREVIDSHPVSTEVAA